MKIVYTGLVICICVLFCGICCSGIYMLIDELKDMNKETDIVVDSVEKHEQMQELYEKCLLILLLEEEAKAVVDDTQTAKKATKKPAKKKTK